MSLTLRLLDDALIPGEDDTTADPKEFAVMRAEDIATDVRDLIAAHADLISALDADGWSVQVDVNEFGFREEAPSESVHLIVFMCARELLERTPSQLASAESERMMGDLTAMFGRITNIDGIAEDMDSATQAAAEAAGFRGGRPQFMSTSFPGCRADIERLAPMIQAAYQATGGGFRVSFGSDSELAALQEWTAVPLDGADLDVHDLITVLGDLAENFDGDVCSSFVGDALTVLGIETI